MKLKNSKLTHPTFLALLLYILFAWSQSCEAQDDVIYLKGNLPIIITVSHNGIKEMENVTDRPCETVQCNNDLYTRTISKNIYKEFSGGQPHVIINNWKRHEIDANRPINEAFVDDKMLNVYSEFHNQITSVINSYIASNEQVLLIDLHGYSGKDYILLGYNLTKEELSSIPNFNTIIHSTLTSAPCQTIEDMIFGRFSMGLTLERFGYKAFPASNTVEEYKKVKYFNGGFIVENYSNYKNVTAIQIELPSNLRSTKYQRNKLSFTLTKVIDSFYNYMTTCIR